MKIKIRTSKVKFSMPVPSSMTGRAIKAIPDSVFDDLRRKADDSLAQYISREMFLMVYEECRDIFDKNKGLEIVHVEDSDGTFVSVKL